MAIPVELSSKFPNERSFVDNFLIPLFRRIGFSLIYDKQGADEFGCDVILGDIDSFGIPNYFGVQAKYVETVGKAEIDDLRKQCIEAFEVPFQHPQRGTQENIGRFYAINGGEFSRQARIGFFNAVPKHLKGCAFCLDGSDVLGLDRGVGLRSVQDLRERLSGLLWEVTYNRVLILGSRDSQPSGGFLNCVKQFVAGSRVAPVRELVLDASKDCIFRPLYSPLTAKLPLHHYWAQCNAYNAVARVIGDISYNELSRIEAAKGSIGSLEQILCHIDVIEAAIRPTLAELGTLAVR